MRYSIMSIIIGEAAGRSRTMRGSRTDTAICREGEIRVRVEKVDARKTPHPWICRVECAARPLHLFLGNPHGKTPEFSPSACDGVILSRVEYF